MKNPEKKQTVAGPKKAASKKKRPAHVFLGVLTSITAAKVMMKGRDGKDSTMSLHDKIKMTCDGITCERSELKPGQKVRVLTQKTDFSIATKIACLDKKTRFGPAA